MTTKRNPGLRRICLERDNFTCRKCKLEDLSGKKLEVHHVLPLIMYGRDELDNLITLCSICHKYAPNSPEEFKEYLDSELDGLTTSLLFIYKKLQEKGVINDTFYCKLKGKSDTLKN